MIPAIWAATAAFMRSRAGILRAIPGMELFEMERIKDQSWCCGGGGGARTAFRDFARKTAIKRIGEAQKNRSSGHCYRLPVLRAEP